MTQIVPTLPPPFEGVGSSALALSEELGSAHGIDSDFLVASPSWSRDPAGAGPEARGIPSPDAATLAQLLTEAEAKQDSGSAVLLHYANYGYEPRGCPTWLIEGLRRWKAGSRARLVTIFHEIHAMGPPWRSSFWLSPLQRRLAAELARLSDGLVTSMGYYRRILSQWVPEEKISLLPVFSAVGEPGLLRPLEQRSRRLVVFGGGGTRGLAYGKLERRMALACRTLGLEEVWDIGPGGESLRPDLPVPWRRLGPLPAAEVSALLAESQAGFIAYPPPFLPKSSIFASYCAHGVIPVCAWPWPRRRVEPPPPFWSPRQDGRGVPDSPAGLQALAGRAHAWYEGHSLERHASTYRTLLFPS